MITTTDEPGGELAVSGADEAGGGRAEGAKPMNVSIPDEPIVKRKRNKPMEQSLEDMIEAAAVVIKNRAGELEEALEAYAGDTEEVRQAIVALNYAVSLYAQMTENAKTAGFNWQVLKAEPRCY